LFCRILVAADVRFLFVQKLTDSPAI